MEKLIKVLIEKRILSFKFISSLRYALKFRKWPDFKEPRTINEKLLWLEFHTDTSQWTECSDKNLVRKYIKDKGLEDILTKQYGVYYDVDDIKFNKLPSSFVLKTNNGYGTVLLIKDKTTVNELELKAKLKQWLKEPFGYKTGEPHYTRIKPCIVIEEMLVADPSISSSLVDYKFWCLNGKVEMCFVCTDRDIAHHSATFCAYTLPDWTRREDWMSPKFKSEGNIPKPSKLQDMMRYAEILSTDFPLVRVDFYEVKEKVYFGEMTFTSNGGRMAYFTEEVLLEMGGRLDISNIKHGS